MPFRTSFDKDCKEYVQTNNIKRKSKVNSEWNVTEVKCNEKGISCLDTV